MESMADQIRGMRTRAGISRAVFAGRMGVAPLTVLRWENGHTTPNMVTALEIARVCADVIQFQCVHCGARHQLAGEE
jgi:DNA-binding XRE family transcriptional regulator